MPGQIFEMAVRGMEILRQKKQNEIDEEQRQIKNKERKQLLTEELKSIRQRRDLARKELEFKTAKEEDRLRQELFQGKRSADFIGEGVSPIGDLPFTEQDLFDFDIEEPSGSTDRTIIGPRGPFSISQEQFTRGRETQRSFEEKQLEKLGREAQVEHPERFAIEETPEEEEERKFKSFTRKEDFKKINKEAEIRLTSQLEEGVSGREIETEEKVRIELLTGPSGDGQLIRGYYGWKNPPGDTEEIAQLESLLPIKFPTPEGEKGSAIFITEKQRNSVLQITELMPVAELMWNVTKELALAETLPKQQISATKNAILGAFGLSEKRKRLEELMADAAAIAEASGETGRKTEFDIIRALAKMINDRITKGIAIRRSTAMSDVIHKRFRTATGNVPGWQLEDVFEVYHESLAKIREIKTGFQGGPIDIIHLPEEAINDYALQNGIEPDEARKILEKAIKKRQ